MKTFKDDKLCFTSNNGGAFTLMESNMLEITEFDEGGTYGSVSMNLPEWLADAIREAFDKKLENENAK